jgi:hypothetical protein
VAVAAALGRTIGRPITIHELITGQGQVRINDGLELERSALRHALSGGGLEVPNIPMSGANLRMAQQMLVKITQTAGWPERLRAVDPDLRLDVLQDFSESDTRMCKNIGVDMVLGATAMAALWRRTFTAERNRRAGPDANAQSRGQISRQLKEELQGVITGGND